MDVLGKRKSLKYGDQVEHSYLESQLQKLELKTSCLLYGTLHVLLALCSTSPQGVLQAWPPVMLTSCCDTTMMPNPKTGLNY